MQTIEQLKDKSHKYVLTQNEILDNFFAPNGCVVGGLYFIYGPPGSSKSTFAQYVLNLVAGLENNLAIYLSNEQDAVTIKMNLERIGATNPTFLFDGIRKEQTDITQIKKVILEKKQENLGKQIWLGLDSLQGITDVKNHPKEHKLDVHIVLELQDFCQKNDIICLLIGQVTKKGQFAGTNGVCHNIDAEINILCDNKNIRSICMKKNRFGASGHQIRLNIEKGIELMPEKALWELDWSKKEDEALMPAPMKVLKENTIAGKIARESLKMGTNQIKRTVINAIKKQFRKKK